MADVECINKDYSFVADAKAFRLSRTAKNQKDFKVQAMDNWKHGKPYAIIICPVYQLPMRKSQIYYQAAARSVCIGTYTHLSVITSYAKIKSKNKAMELLHKIFKTIDTMNPSKEAYIYWRSINQTMLNFDDEIISIWKDEKRASLESIMISKEEALTFLSKERERIMKLSRNEAVNELLKYSKIKNKMKAINSVSDNGLLEIN